LGASQAVGNCERRRPSYYELAETDPDIACRHQRGDQLLWLWQAKLHFSISAVESPLLVSQPAWAGQMEGTCLAGGQTASR